MMGPVYFLEWCVAPDDTEASLLPSTHLDDGHLSPPTPMSRRPAS